MGSLPQSFSQLALGDSAEPTRLDFSPTLHRVSDERDALTEDEHREIEEGIASTYSMSRQSGVMPDLNHLLVVIASEDERLVKLSAKKAQKLLDSEPSIEMVLRKAWEQNSYKQVRQLEVLWPEVKETRKRSRYPASQSHAATLGSWTIPYVGDASAALYDHLNAMPTSRALYAKLVPIVQSSGMGKSRAIDELAKTHLVVPLNLRKGGTGFPAADKDVREWLLQSKTKMESYARAGAFLCALFTTVLNYLQDIDSKVASIDLPSDETPPVSIAAKFRLLMTADQTFFEQGQLRRDFYTKVLDLADKLCEPPASGKPSSSPPLPFNLVQGADGSDVTPNLKSQVLKLSKYLIGGTFTVNANYPSVIILSFDEADCLTDIAKDKNGDSWSNFAELRRALRVIHSYPCTSIFISTMGKVKQFIPDAHHDPSSQVARGVLSLRNPFCELGFDQLAETAISGQTTLDDVSSDGFIARLGRPLFAARYIKGDAEIQGDIILFAIEKLICKPFKPNEPLSWVEKMACISVRLPFEFNRTNLAGREAQRTLVEKHMRVCLSVDPEFETAVTIAPSEPLLAEASRTVMRETVFDYPRELQALLQFSGLDKGDHGELVAMLLCLEACDAARTGKPVISVVDFFRYLLASETHDSVLKSMPLRARSHKDWQTFESTFQRSKMYFNHFVRLRDRKSISRRFFWYLIIRGAAALCIQGQVGIDIIIPFLFWNSVLRREDVSAIFIQVKNDVTYQATILQYLFDSMDPCDEKTQFFDKDESDPVPIIRMVFALASDTSCVKVSPPPPRTQPLRTSKEATDKYTAFDIWCAKVSRETFRQVEDKEHVYQNLLHRYSVFPGVYTSKPTEALQKITRNMNPATETDPAHYERFGRV